jgi:hypothetical protein
VVAKQLASFKVLIARANVSTSTGSRRAHTYRVLEKTPGKQNITSSAATIPVTLPKVVTQQLARLNQQSKWDKAPQKQQSNHTCDASAKW